MEHLVTFFAHGLHKQPTGYIDLVTWLKANSHEGLVKAARKGMYVKGHLPCVLPAGIFEGGRRKDNFKRGTGLLFVDIDRKTNPNIEGVRKLFIEKCDWLYALASSSGGHGLSAFLRIPNIRKGEMYTAYHKEMQVVLGRMGINIDPACSNVNRQRFAGFDKNVYVNEDAQVLKLVNLKPIRKSVENVVVEVDDATRKDIVRRIEYLDKIKHDITLNYNDWLYIAGFLNVVFGPKLGLALFHRVSKHYPGYDPDEAESKYIYCMSFKNGTAYRFFQLLTPNN